MKTITIKVFGNRETIEIAANNDYETVFNEVEKALRNLYEISDFRRRHGNKCFGFEASEGKNSLIFGIGLSADKSGKIIWETCSGFDIIARGTTEYSRYVDRAFWHMASMIINHFGLTDQISEEDETAQETAEAFDPYSMNFSKCYAVSWIESECKYVTTLNKAYFPTEEMAEQFAALLKGAGYKGVEVVNGEELAEEEEEDLPF